MSIVHSIAGAVARPARTAPAGRLLARWGERAGAAERRRPRRLHLPADRWLLLALVAAFYMHLKNDSKVFTSVFVFPIIIAAIVIVSLVILMAYHIAFARAG